MDITILIAISAVLISILITFTLYLKTKNEQENKQQQQAPNTNRGNERAPRRGQVVRNRGGQRLRANIPQNHQQPAANDDDNEPETAIKEFPDGKIGAKKRAKLEAKAEKKMQREMDEQQRLEKQKKDQLVEEERKKAEENELLESKKREEFERKLKEERERREHEEYLKMKEAFSIDEEGFEETGDDTEKNLLQEFIDYIKTNKVVVIEDLASHFKLKTQATIDRIKELCTNEQLSGVIDDRGKFIYISEDEMNAVVKFIRQRGRVSIAELAENSSQLINLTPVSIVN